MAVEGDIEAVRSPRKREWVHRCPRCRAIEIEQSPRKNALERVFLALVRQRAYRCRRCDRRFYDIPTK